MKKFAKILAVALALACLCGVFAACTTKVGDFKFDVQTVWWEAKMVDDGGTPLKSNDEAPAAAEAETDTEEEGSDESKESEETKNLREDDTYNVQLQIRIGVQHNAFGETKVVEKSKFAFVGLEEKVQSIKMKRVGAGNDYTDKLDVESPKEDAEEGAYGVITFIYFELSFGDVSYADYQQLKKDFSKITYDGVQLKGWTAGARYK